MPEDATACVIGWPELIGEALRPPGRPRCARGRRARRGQRARAPAPVRRDRRRRRARPPALGAAAAAADVVLLEAVGPRARPASSASAARGPRPRSPAMPRCPSGWCAGVGRLLPARIWDALSGRLAGVPAEPWDARRGARAARRSSTASCGAERPRSAGRRPPAHGLPGRPGALRRRERPRHLHGDAPARQRPMSRRDQIRMSDDEIERVPRPVVTTMNVASFNHDGTIHLVAMWYADARRGSRCSGPSARARRSSTCNAILASRPLVESGDRVRRAHRRGDRRPRPTVLNRARRPSWPSARGRGSPVLR